MTFVNLTSQPGLGVGGALETLKRKYSLLPGPTLQRARLLNGLSAWSYLETALLTVVNIQSVFMCVYLKLHFHELSINLKYEVF